MCVEEVVGGLAAVELQVPALVVVPDTRVMHVNVVIQRFSLKQVAVLNTNNEYEAILFSVNLLC